MTSSTAPDAAAVHLSAVAPRPSEKSRFRGGFEGFRDRGAGFVLRRSKASWLVPLGYAAVSFVYFGWRLLPHPGRGVIGASHDSQIYIWSFAWWTHAIEHGQNPFLTHVLYAPTGIDTAWTLTVPGLAIVFVPVTALLGPVVSYNLAAVLMPVVCSWSAYVLFRYLTGSVWASFVGGYLFGFSTAMLRQQLYGHLPVTGVFLLPLVALVVVRYVREDLERSGLVWRLGLLLAAQLWLSTEFALTVTLVLALALMLGFALLPGQRARIVSALPSIVVAYVVGALVAAPLVYYALTGFVTHGFIDVRHTGSDVLNFVVPTRVIAVGGSWLTSLQAHFEPSGASAYLGLPTLAIAALFAWRFRGVAWARFLVVLLAAVSVMALGVELDVGGRRLFALPWAAIAHVPVVNNALPFRFTAYVSLAAAAIVALWTATRPGRFTPRPVVLPALAIVALVPSVWRDTYPTFATATPVRPSFFTDGLDERCLGRGETIAAFPFGGGGDSLLWQAESDFRFRLAGDGLQAPDQALNAFDAERVAYELNYTFGYARPTVDRLLAFAARHRVDRFLSLPGGYPSRAQMERIGPTELVGGMLVSPACGRRTLRARDLSSFVARDPDTTIGSAPNIGWCVGVNFNLLPQGTYPAGPLAAAKLGIVVQGKGLTCPPPPSGYERRGFATPDMGVPADTYAYYAR
jgi:hypothetical protein